MVKTRIVIPNWNGADYLPTCLNALLSQTKSQNIIVVDNASTDNSSELIENEYPNVTILQNHKNLGFAGGVNTGIRYALDDRVDYIALINNDAVSDRDWLKNLLAFMNRHLDVGIATSKIISLKDGRLDSTGEQYTVWGLPYPRGRGQEIKDKYENEEFIFGASGGASLYRVKMLEEIGLFDEDFFAYYEDVDISFRAQLAGWKVGYVPSAEAYHEIGATSSQIKGFATYQTLKNLPMLLWKNVPLALMPKVFPRFVLLYGSITASALRRGQIIPVLKGVGLSILLLPKKLVQRYRIQQSRKVSVEYINSIIAHDLPPNAHKLRRLRAGWWKVIRRKAA